MNEIVIPRSLRRGILTKNTCNMLITSPLEILHSLQDDAVGVRKSKFYFV
jgi:hypothetical protein